MIGERLREARETRGLSLTDVATEAHISAATLSRIETGKQGLDFGLFLIIAKVLAIAPIDLMDADGDNSDPIINRIAHLSSTERTRMWRELTETRRNSRAKRQTRRSDTLAQQMEELFAQFDYIREELESVRNTVRRRNRPQRVTSASSE